MLFSGRSLIATMMQQQPSTTAVRFELPYYVIQGREDIATPTAPAEAYFANVVAPKKKMVVIENAGHFALATHTEEFIRALRRMTR
jgi:pimeloyl-ACP methyl ester carboxylesterase